MESRLAHALPVHAHASTRRVNAVFGHRITRPLRWAIPLALGGFLTAAVLTWMPVETDELDCGSVREYVWHGRPSGWFAYAPNSPDQDPFEQIERCDDRLQRRAAVAGGISFLASVPLAVLSVRGFLWGASVLARVERDLDAA